MEDGKFGYKVTDDTNGGRPSLCISVPGMRYPLRIILPPRNCLESELMDATGCTSIDVPGTSYDPPLCEDLCEDSSSVCDVTRSNDDILFNEVRQQNVRKGVVCRGPNPRENRRRTVQGVTSRSHGKEGTRPDVRANRRSVSPNRNLTRNRNSRSPSPTKNIQNIPKQKIGTNCRLVCDFDERSSITLPASRAFKPRWSKNGHEAVCNTRNVKKSNSPEAAHVTTEARGFLNVCSQTDVPFGSPRARNYDETRFMDMLIPTKNLMKKDRYDDCCVLKEKFDSIQVLAQAVYNANCRNTTVSRLIEHRESANQTDKVIDKRGMSVQTEKLKPALKEMSTEISHMDHPKRVEIEKPEEKTDPEIRPFDKQVETERPEEKADQRGGSVDKQVETEKPEDTTGKLNETPETEMTEQKKRETQFGSKASFMLVDDSLPQIKNLKEKNAALKSFSTVDPQNAEIASPQNADPIPGERMENKEAFPSATEEKPIVPSDPAPPPERHVPIPDERRENKEAFPIATEEKPIVPSDLAAPPERHICEYCKSIKCRCMTVEEQNVEEKKLKFEEVPKEGNTLINEEKVPKKSIIRIPSEGTLPPQEPVESTAAENQDSPKAISDWRKEIRPPDFSTDKIVAPQVNDEIPKDQNLGTEGPIEKEIPPEIPKAEQEPNAPNENLFLDKNEPEKEENQPKLEIPSEKSIRKVNIAPTEELDLPPDDQPRRGIRDMNILGLSPGESAENMTKRMRNNSIPEDVRKSVSDDQLQPLQKVISEPTIHEAATPEMSKVTEPLNTKTEPREKQNTFDISYERNCPVFDERYVRYSERPARGVTAYDCHPNGYEWRNCLNERQQSLDSLEAARASCEVNRRRRPPEEYECEERVTLYVPDDNIRPGLPRYVPSDDDRAQYFYVPSTSNKGTSQDPNCDDNENSKAENLAEQSRSVRIQSEENQYFEDTSPRRGLLGSIWDGIRNIF